MGRAITGTSCTCECDKSGIKYFNVQWDIEARYTPTPKVAQTALAREVSGKLTGGLDYTLPLWLTKPMVEAQHTNN